ncbi:MAG TPA: ABC transporter permease [Gemmatimonadaceae bacterium]
MKAARRLLRAPSFAFAALLTLALGIGAATAVFEVVDAVLLSPLPYPDAGRLVGLSHTLAVSGISEVDQSDASYLYYRGASHVFTDIGAYSAGAVNLGAVDGAGAGDDARPERAGAARITPSVLSVLRAAPIRGRAFAADDDVPGAAPVVLIGERLWRTTYGADPGIVGRRIRVDGVAREVVGIMPAAFAFPDASTELWLPSGIDPMHTESATFDWQAVARLRDGVTPASAGAELTRLLPRLPESFPGRLTASAIAVTQMRAVVRPLRDIVVGDVGRVLWVVLGAVGFVLLIACANVANLFLVRAEGRQREMAVRRALGAGRPAMLGEFLGEAAVVAALGGALGLVLAALGVHLLRTLGAGMNVPRITEVHLSLPVLAFAVVVTALAALLVAAVPALRSGAISPAAALAGSGRSATVGRERRRARSLLVAAQVALALVLLAGAGLMARSFARLRSVRPGFDPAHALALRVSLPEPSYRTPESVAEFDIRAVDGIAALPGVEAVGIASKLPLDAEGKQDTAVWVEDHPLRPHEMPGIHPVAYVSAGFFRAMGIPLVAGRTFDRVDPARAPLDVVVSRALAERYWKGESAIGKRIRLNPRSPWSTVIGVAGDVRGAALEQPPEQMVYCPLVAAQGAGRWTPRDVAIVVRARGAVSSIEGPVRATVRELDPAIPVYRSRPLDALVSRASARTSFTLLLLGIASAMSLALGAVGIYGVISYTVSLRTREIGVRLALGARPADVRRMVSRQALALAAAGVVAGLAGAAVLTRLLAALLYEVSPTDPVTLGGAALLLLLVAVAASWLPARRASAVDPGIALRGE